MDPSPLSPHLTRFRRRFRLVDGVTLVQRTLWMVLVASLAVQLAGRLWPVENLAVYTLLPLPAWLLLVVGYTLFKPVPNPRLARRIDRQLGLKERISTALALREMDELFAEDGEGPQPAHHALQNFDRRLVSAQQQDALAAIQDIQAALAVPFTWLSRPLAAAGLLLVVTLAAALLPNPQDAVIAQRRAVEKEAQDQAARVEQMQEKIAQSDDLTEEEKEELLKQLQELLEALKNNPGDLEQALADLSKMEQAIQERLDPNAPNRQANLESLAEQLQQIAGMERKPGQELSDAAAEALNALAQQAGQISEQERQDAAQDLAQMAAQAAQAGNQDLAQALSALAQAMQNGDPQVVQQAAGQAQSEMNQAQANLNAQAALQQVQGQLQASRQQLAQAAAQTAGQQVNNSQQPGQGNQSSQGQQPGQGNQPGQGSQPGLANQPGGNRPGGGGGSTANTLPPNTAAGQAGRPTGDRPAPPPTTLDSQVYTPWQSSPFAGEQVFIPGQDSGQGQTQVTEGQSNQPGMTNPSLIPYSQVYHQYASAANQALQQSYIPPALKSYIEQYFSQLEPK